VSNAAIASFLSTLKPLEHRFGQTAASRAAAAFDTTPMLVFVVAREARE
jgi:hypothetical protein